MDQDTRERIRIFNEKGILQMSGRGFHSPLEFAVDHMFYTIANSDAFRMQRKIQQILGNVVEKQKEGLALMPLV